MNASLAHSTGRPHRGSLLVLWVASLLALVLAPRIHADNTTSPRLSILEAGAIPDGSTLNTVVIQRAIDRLASQGGGTLVVPQGRFLTGALFLKPKVNLHLDKEAVLLGSQRIEDYPERPTRIEGHTQVWRPALLNASKCDHLRITGEGTLQGGGKPFWDAFWSRYEADKKTKNLDVHRPRNLLIEDSEDVVVSGISLRDSGFWNFHLYRCRQVLIEKMDIRTPRRAPSTDGIDVDSSQHVTIRDCFISVDDDNIAMKGTKGALADQDKDSPAVEHVLIQNCRFALGHGVVTLGSEACHVRDVVVENCSVEGSTENRNVLIRLKLRPDTPQHYEDIHFRNIRIAHQGIFISIEPWTQYFDLQGHEAPRQLVENVTATNITGATSGFGKIVGPPHSTIRNIRLENIDLKLRNPDVVIRKVDGLQLINVKVNGIPVEVAPAMLAAPSLGDDTTGRLPSPESVLGKMALANQHFLTTWPEPGKPIVALGKTWPSNIWTRAVYFEGLMALYQINRDPRLMLYAEQWAESHKWGLPRGPKTRNADNQCCGQTYIELYQLSNDPMRLHDIKASIDGMLATDRTDDWSWIDALQMSMPVFAKLGALTDDPRYYAKMHALYEHALKVHGGKGLYQPADRLWWRDKDFVSPYREPNGEDCYWARGNGWVVAALVRVLDVLPVGAPHRTEYEDMLKGMLAALVPLQREDGFWNVSLHDPTHFGGRELTGTALFTYGMAWALNHGLIDRKTYLPCVIKAWGGMSSEALHKDGRLGYVQSTGKEPKDGQPVTFEGRPDFEDYGLGCFLLAGSEVHALSLSAPK